MDCYVTRYGDASTLMGCNDAEAAWWSARPDRSSQTLIPIASMQLDGLGVADSHGLG